MTANAPPSRSLRILSIVEATSVTGPLKPLLMFAEMHTRFDGRLIERVLLTTRREPLSGQPDQDPLRHAALAAGMEYITARESAALDPMVLKKYANEIARLNPDIVETHDCKSAFLFYLLRRKHISIRRLTWVAFHHGYTRTSWKVRLYQKLDRLTLRHANHVVTLCRPFADELAQQGVQRQRLSVISNAVRKRDRPSDREISEARQQLGIASNEIVMICVGRLSSEKGQHDLITAFGMSNQKASERPTRLLFVGDGPDRPALEKEAAPFNHRVIFAGHVRDPWTLFHAADIFVLPSHSEGSPLVLFEAMAAHVPIVATSVGGVPETVSDGSSALLVAKRNPTMLAEALSKLVRDADLRKQLSTAAFESLSRFSPEAYAAQLLAIYRQAIATAT